MVLAIGERWKKIPPLSVSVAAIAKGLGMKDPESATPKPVDAAGLDELVAVLGSVSTEKPEWLKTST
jgi:hypothetical protein